MAWSLASWSLEQLTWGSPVKKLTAENTRVTLTLCKPCKQSRVRMFLCLLQREESTKVVHLEEALLFTVVSFQAFFSVPVLRSLWDFVLLTLGSAIFGRNGNDKLPYVFFFPSSFFVGKRGSSAEVDLVTPPFHWSPLAHAHKVSWTLSLAHPVWWCITYGI